MRTNFRWQIKPPPVLGRRRGLSLTLIGRAARTKLPLCGPHWRYHARAGVPAHVSPRTRFPHQPPRERGTWRTFGLAVAMHALLAAFLFSGMHWPRNTPASAQAVVTGRLVPPPLASPVPRIANQSAGSLVTLSGASREPRSDQAVRRTEIQRRTFAQNTVDGFWVSSVKRCLAANRAASCF
jgi:hypothetical protein